MKSDKIFKWFIVSCLFIGIVSCDSKKRIATFHTHQTECLGIEMDGSQTLMAWGTGRNRLDAVEQAKKTAVRDVLFSGIIAGKPECQVRPVLPEVNVLERNEGYFNHFFADDGEFLNYVLLTDERIGHRILRDRQKAGNQVTQSIIARVDRPGLIEKMRKDGLLKQNQ